MNKLKIIHITIFYLFSNLWSEIQGVEVEEVQTNMADGKFFLKGETKLLSDSRTFYNPDDSEKLLKNVPDQTKLNEDVYGEKWNSTFYLEIIYNNSKRSNSKRIYCASALRISKNILITAAHNLYDKMDKDDGFPDRIDCFGACYNNNVLSEKIIKNIDNSGVCHNEESIIGNIFVHKEYIENNNKYYDIALIIFNEDLGQGSFVNPIFIEDKKEINSIIKEITIVGYPGQRVAHAHTGELLEYNECNIIKYKVSTKPGQSGSGICGTPSSKSRYCYGVHTTAGKSEENFNIGVLITKEIYDLIDKRKIQ